MIYEFDTDKNQVNLDRGFPLFNLAVRVFDDLNSRNDFVRVDEFGEERFRILGMIDDVLHSLIYSVRTNRRGEATVRFISFRKASNKEARIYNEPE